MVSRYTELEYGRSALITIDVQRDMLDGQPFEIPGTSQIVPNLQRLTRFFRSHRRPIVHIVRLYEQDGSNVDLCRREEVERGAQLVIAGSMGSQTAAPLLPSCDAELDAPVLLSGGVQELGPFEWAIYKPRWGAFYRTPLEEHLRRLHVSTLVFTGCNFPNCPRTSIYEASERDFRIVAIEDAISALYDRGLEELAGIGVVVTDTDRYLEEADC